MFLHRFVLLIAVTYLGPGPGGSQCALPSPSSDWQATAAERTLTSSITPAQAPHARLSRLRAWRHRIKSVLDDKVAWCPQPTELGAADGPDLIEPSNGVPFITVSPASSRPLRC